MDTMTYIVVAGWVLMYFMPALPLAFVTATVMGLLAAFLIYLGGAGGGPLDMAGFMTVAMPVAPISFFAIFMAWPLGVFFRRIRGWWRRKAAGA